MTDDANKHKWVDTDGDFDNKTVDSAVQKFIRLAPEKGKAEKTELYISEEPSGPTLTESNLRSA